MQKINFQDLPSTSTPLNASNLNQLQTNVENAISGVVESVENAINGVIESGENANGNYVKYADGTMICDKTVTANVAMTTQWGSLYEGTISLGNWAEEFTDVPNIQVTNASTVGAMIECFQTLPTKASAGVLNLVRANSATFPVIINVLGKGYWK